ncbi:13785_t:CDS:2 [Acaulospora morrowiae]|uniref:13785_t:CDS:1 n=1 Tax=Acaulospora morrowiae TaxID=94023 RepID=A0A9N9B9D7_9GLOM|nr:13785_t:CDS:2 [Acaulospora morrowiae]
MTSREKPPAYYFYSSILFMLLVFVSFFLLDHVCPFPESVVSGDPWWKTHPLIVIVTVIDNNNFSQGPRGPSETISGFSSKKFFNITKKALENKERYADFYGYEVAVKDVKDWTRSTSWAKIPALLEAMDEFPSSHWFWFMDSYLIVSNPVQIANYVLQNVTRASQMLIGYDCHGLNANSFFIKNTEWSRNFLNTVHKRELFERFEEEGIVMQMLIDYEVIEAVDKIHFVPFRSLNALPLAHDCGKDERYLWHKDDFVFNLSGCNTNAECEKVIREIGMFD